MRGKSQFIPIDGKTLKVLITSWCAENHTNIYDLSKTAGYSASWLYDICKVGRIRKVGIDFLKKTCDINYESYRSANGDRVCAEAGSNFKKHADYVNIDGKKLEALLNNWCSENETNIYDLSIKFGYSKKWLPEAIKYNRLRNVGVMLLKYETGIEYEDYKYVEPEPVVKEEKKDISTDFGDQEAKEYLDKFLSRLDRIADALEELNKSLK